MKIVKLTDEQVVEMRRSYVEDGQLQRNLAIQYRVGQDYVSRIVRGIDRTEAGGPTVDVGFRGGFQLSDKVVAEIRQARRDGLTLAELAVKYDVTVSYVSMLCNGRRRREAGGPITPKHTRNYRHRRAA
jgi:predicted transcriptional regulator